MSQNPRIMRFEIEWEKSGGEKEEAGENGKVNYW